MAPNGHLLIDRDWEATELGVKSAVDPEAVHAQMQLVLSDPLFHNSKRYSEMLKYIVDRTLDGQHECLKERIIGIEVFARTPDYDTSVDSIVRVAAAEVRKRLTRYYEEPQHDQELRIELPTRSYVAEFKLPERGLHGQQVGQEQPPSGSPSVLSERTPAYRQQRFGLSYAWIAVAAVILIFAIWGAQRTFAPTPVIDRFWAPILNNSGSTLITMGSPAWFRQTPAATGGAPVSPAPEISLSQLIEKQVNFPLADLSAASAMTSFLARHGKESVMRLSDSTTLSDLHGNPVIVLGSFPNEWALRLGANLPFQFGRSEGLQWIEDTRHPADKKWVINMHAPYEQVTGEYALITRAVDQTTGQWWVGISGLTVLGTIAGQQMVTDPRAMAALASHLPRDWAARNLQIVIEFDMVHGSLGASHVVATYSW